MFFDSVYSTRPSNNGGKFTIFYMERFFDLSWVLFCSFILWLAKMGCIFLNGIEYLLNFLSKNPQFSSCPSNTKIQTATDWW